MAGCVDTWRWPACVGPAVVHQKQTALRWAIPPDESVRKGGGNELMDGSEGNPPWPQDGEGKPYCLPQLQ